MGWQDGNDFYYGMFNLGLNASAYPYSWTSTWGNSLQFNMNSIMDMNPAQALSFQNINNAVQYGIPMNPFMSTPGMPSCGDFVNNGMLRGVAQRSVTTASTLTNIKTELNKMLKKEGVTAEQKAQIQEQIAKVEALEAKIKAFQKELEKGGNWQEKDAKLEALLGEKTEIDKKIKEIIDAVAKNNTEGEEDETPAAPATKAEAQNQLKEEYGKNPPAGVTVTDDGKFEYKGKKYDTIADLKAAIAAENPPVDGDPDGDADAEVTAAETATATTKADAESNLKKVYGEGNVPAGVTVTEDGKFEYNGQKYDTISDLKTAIAATVDANAQSKTEAENNLKATYGEGKIPASITVTEDGKFQREVTVMKDGKEVKETKTYDSILAMQSDAKKNTHGTVEEAAENLKIVYGENIPEGMKADSNHPGTVCIDMTDIKDGKLAEKVHYGSIEDCETEMKAAKARVEAYEKAQSEVKRSKRDQIIANSSPEDVQAAHADAASIAQISDEFAEAVDGPLGTDNKKFKSAISKLNGYNVIEVFNHYKNSNKNPDRSEEFIEAFEDDASSGQQYKLGNYIYNALVQRAKIAGLLTEDPKYVELPEGSDEYERVSDRGNYAIKSNVKGLAEQFKELLDEFNAYAWTSSGDVEKAVEAIVKAIEDAEKVQ